MKRVAIGVFFVPIALIAQHNGDVWANIGPTPAAVEAIAVDPHGSGITFIGTNSGGIRRSVDGGITWSAVNTGLTNLDVERLAFGASGPQTVYAGTRGGLFKTVDGGAMWQNVPGDPRPGGWWVLEARLGWMVTCGHQYISVGSAVHGGQWDRPKQRWGER